MAMPPVWVWEAWGAPFVPSSPAPVLDELQGDEASRASIDPVSGPEPFGMRI